MKRTLTIAIALVSCLLILIPASAQGPRGGGGRGGIGPAGANGLPSRRVLERALDLSEEQFAELEMLLEAHREATKPLHEEIRALEKELRTELNAGTAGATEIGQIVIDVHGLRGQVHDAQQALQDSFRALLTDAQLAALEELSNRRGRGRRGSRGGGSGSGGSGTGGTGS